MKQSFAAVVATVVLCCGFQAEAKKNNNGMQATELDPTSRGIITGIGIESRDIDAMADMVVRDLMTRPDLVGTGTPPRIVVDSEKFINQSSQRIDRDMITDSLRSSLSRAAAGRMRFLSRESMDIVLRERELKRSGQVDVGTRGMTRAVAGSDYKLIGRMTSLDQRNLQTGRDQRRTQILFEIVDLESGELVWTSQPYVILRAAGDDVVYR